MHKVVIVMTLKVVTVTMLKRIKSIPKDVEVTTQGRESDDPRVVKIDHFGLLP